MRNQPSNRRSASGLCTGSYPFPSLYQWPPDELTSRTRRGIWKVHSRVCYLSNQLTFIFGIILNRNLFYVLRLKFQEDALMQAGTILFRMNVLFVFWKDKVTLGNLKNVQNINN